MLSIPSLARALVALLRGVLLHLRAPASAHHHLFF